MKRSYQEINQSQANEEIYQQLLSQDLNRAKQFLLKNYKSINLNRIFENNGAGANSYYYLAALDEGWNILLANPDLLINADFNAGPLEGPFKGTNGYYWLVGSPKGRQILLTNPDLLKNADFNAGPVVGSDKGTNGYFWLVSNSENYQMLLDNPVFLKNANLNAGPVEGPHRGTNGYSWLAITPKGRQILLDNPDLLKKANFNARSPDKEGGHTFFSDLICNGNSLFKQFFEDNVEVLETINWAKIDTTVFTRIVSDEMVNTTQFLLVNGFIPWDLCIQFSTTRNTSLKKTFHLYVQAVQLIENKSWKDLETLVATFPWLIQAKYDGDTLLHRLVEKLNYYPQCRLLNFIESTSLLNQLEPCRNVRNKNQEIPALLATDVHLREKLRNTNDFQKGIESTLLDRADLKKLVQDFLSGFCSLPSNYSIKSNQINPLTKELKSIELPDLEAAKFHLMELLNQIISYDHLLDELCLLALKTFMDETQKYISTRDKFKLQPLKILTVEESKSLENLMANLFNLNSYAFDLAKGMNGEIDNGAARFFSHRNGEGSPKSEGSCVSSEDFEFKGGTPGS